MRFHRDNDEWGRGSYAIPQYAVAGCSYTGEWDDSPCPGKTVQEELAGLQAALAADAIRSRLQTTPSGNHFMVKAWVVVHRSRFARASALTLAYLEANKDTTRLIHDADLRGADLRNTILEVKT